LTQNIKILEPEPELELKLNLELRKGRQFVAFVLDESSGEVGCEERNTTQAGSETRLQHQMRENHWKR
jgi:hypothetical protein